MSRVVTNVSGGSGWFGLLVFAPVVLITATAPASHMATYTRLLSAEATVNKRKRVLVGVYEAKVRNWLRVERRIDSSKTAAR